MDIDNHYWGMHLFWWFLWVMMFVWIFVTPYSIPGQKFKRDSPLDILKKRLATGEIENKEFQEKRILLEKN